MNKRTSIGFLWLLLGPLWVMAAGGDLPTQDYLSRIQLQESEVSTYQAPAFADQLILQMGYASSQIRNTRDWQADTRPKKVLEIDLVFTQYPKRKADWLTNYDSLLNNRIHALHVLIPDLALADVKWNLILQTGCQNEAQAKTYFHGAVVRYQLLLSDKIRESLSTVRNIIIGKEAFADSVVFNVFGRNPQWSDILVVNDWTASMYDYGAQAVLWHRLHFHKKAIKHFVFFNDGNLTPNKDKVIGQTGGIYSAKADQVKEIIGVMREVMVHGNGGDTEENDLEAVLYGIRQFPDFKEVVLIADNNSPVRDMALLSQIHVPVRVILCGVNPSTGIEPHYLDIARATGGSVHTIEQDLEQLASVKNGEEIQLGGIAYRLESGRFVKLHVPELVGIGR